MFEELLKLARENIKSKLEGNKLVVEDNIKKKFRDNGACFVTLTINNELRGCIGSLESFQALYQDVIDNSIHAAFEDPRFLPLNKKEFDKIKIEISILSKPVKLEYKDEIDLLNKINNEMGLILKRGFYSATFLPQVWEDLPDKINFLEHLSRKAGLSKDAWKKADFMFYNVEKIKEK
ncbi:MAG: AmmeMemoRadiSam system protein A [Candidatus Pacearchaeota archaeon]|jgi:AmmeMemoRadiSam system protein A